VNAWTPWLTRPPAGRSAITIRPATSGHDVDISVPRQLTGLPRHDARPAVMHHFVYGRKRHDRIGPDNRETIVAAHGGTISARNIRSGGDIY